MLSACPLAFLYTQWQNYLSLLFYLWNLSDMKTASTRPTVCHQAAASLKALLVCTTVPSHQNARSFRDISDLANQFPSPSLLLGHLLALSPPLEFCCPHHHTLLSPSWACDSSTENLFLAPLCLPAAGHTLDSSLSYPVLSCCHCLPAFTPSSPLPSLRPSFSLFCFYTMVGIDFRIVLHLVPLNGCITDYLNHSPIVGPM